MRKRRRPKADNPKKRIIAFRLDQNKYDELKDYAESCDFTMTELIRVSLNYYRNQCEQ